MHIRDFIGPSERVREFFRRCNVEKFAVGDCIEILACPVDAWKYGNARIELQDDLFDLPLDLRRLASAYGTKHRSKKNTVRLYVRELGPSFIDDSTLKLSLGLTRYFDVLAFQEELLEAKSPSDSLRRAYDCSFNDPQGAKAPHILGVEATAVTKDNMLVLGLRSGRVDWYPHTWSVSFEEQVSPKDRKAGNELLFRTASRGANEEYLGRDSKVVQERSARFFSVFLKYDVLNFSLCSHVEIPMSFSELLSRWREAQPDPEFEDLQAVGLELEGLAELVLPDRCLLGLHRPGRGAWHPTSRYRILKLMLHRWGYDRVLAALKAAKPLRPIHPERSPILAEIGIHDPTGKGVQWKFAHKQDGHLLIVGRSGTGKSSVIRKIIAEARATDAFVTVVDPKGDLTDIEFASTHGLRKIQVNDALPFNPLELPTLKRLGPEATATDLGRVLRESCGLSAKEGLLLRELVQGAYELQGIRQADPNSWNGPTPKWNVGELLDLVRRDPAGSLKSKLRSVILAPGLYDLSELANSGTILDLRDATENLASAAVGILFLAAYEMACYGREEYTVLILDEAHRFKRLSDLELILREGRHHDVALIMATQIAVDLGQEVPRLAQRVKTIRHGVLKIGARPGPSVTLQP